MEKKTEKKKIRHSLPPIFPYHCVTGVVSRTDKHVAGDEDGGGVESGESDRAVGQRNRRFASRRVEEEHGGGGKWRGRRDPRHTLVPISP